MMPQPAEAVDPASWTAPSTLGQILEHLGIRVLDVVAAPEGLEVHTRETVVVGVGEPLPDRPGGVLLAAGSGVDVARTERLITGCRRGGLCRGRGEDLRPPD